jgi:hypothetical protein
MNSKLPSLFTPLISLLLIPPSFSFHFTLALISSLWIFVSKYSKVTIALYNTSEPSLLQPGWYWEWSQEYKSCIKLIEASFTFCIHILQCERLSLREQSGLCRFFLEAYPCSTPFSGSVALLKIASNATYYLPQQNLLLPIHANIYNKEGRNLLIYKQQKTKFTITQGTFGINWLWNHYCISQNLCLDSDAFRAQSYSSGYRIEIEREKTRR